MNKKEEHPFKPIVFKDSEILILGSFPSIKSFENDFYYANPKNMFWKILEQVTSYPVNNKDQKLWLLKEKKIALWDIIARCNRDSSLDSSLEDEEVNDIALFLEKNTNIKKILFSGRKAETLFEMHFAHLGIARNYLPSPSSAYAKLSFEKKVALYKKELETA